MKGLVSYQFMNYLRSYKYIPPFTLYFMFLVINYTYLPNPILDTYSTTSLVLFFIMGWVTVTLFHAEDDGQKVITLLHAKNKLKYHLSLYVIGAFLGLFLSIVAIVYPIVFDGFGVKVRLVHILLGFLSHLSLSVLSLALSALFTREITKNKNNTWWGVISILVFSVIITSLKSYILHVKGLIWLLPPVHLSLEMMNTKDSINAIPGTFFLQFAWIFLYGILILGVYLLFIKRRGTL